MRLYIYPPTAVSVTVPPIAYTDGGVNTPVTPETPLPVLQSNELKGFAVLDFASDPVTDSAYVELISTVGSVLVKKVQIAMTAGEPLYLAYGAPGLETDMGIIIRGGNGSLDLKIPANTRLSVKAVNAVTVNEGDLIINLLG